MSLLLFILVVLVVLALAIYAANQLPAMDPPIRQIIILVMVVIAIVLIVQRAGLL